MEHEAFVLCDAEHVLAVQQNDQSIGLHLEIVEGNKPNIVRFRVKLALSILENIIVEYLVVRCCGLVGGRSKLLVF